MILSAKVGDAWTPVLDASALIHVQTDTGAHICVLGRVIPIEHGLLLTGDCSTLGTFEQRFILSPENDVVEVATRFKLAKGVPERSLHSVEDRYDFLPPRNAVTGPHTGPLDFVWSQNIKSEAGDLIPTNGFKSPVVMLQQGRVFAALMPHLNERHAEVRALDLDVTSGPHPWLAYGDIPSQPHGHSYFRRSREGRPEIIDGSVAYRYSVILSSEPPRLGYRRVVHRLWQQMGHSALLASADEQQDVLRPELRSFDSWRQEAWHTYADRVYTGFPCGGKRCGTLRSDRNSTGDWEHPEPDAWFNAWFQTLRTAYGWYLYGQAAHDPAMTAKAESVLNLILTSPRDHGAFSTIYLVNKNKWIPGDGWASYADSYHAFSMSWTAYWMLRWADDLTPNRKSEILQFVRPYGDFLLAHQQPSGNIPSWYRSDTLEPRSEFRDFNAETAVSALLLTTLGTSTGDPRYLAAAEHAMNFVTAEVLPRQRWFDFETYLSCAHKDFAFYDSWTAQFPQNNLAEIQAVQAMLALSKATGKPQYLQQGTEMLDYLLLTQQVWNNPLFTPRLLGGFTTQNTDAEWSDARQGYAAVLLADFYQATGNIEYLERAVAASRSTLAVAPWENWAHTGYRDEPGALTGFHWGTGSAMTSVELLAPTLGDAFIDLTAKQGVGFDECSITDVDVRPGEVSFHITSPARQRRFLIRFRGIEPSRNYRIRWNNGPTEQVAGTQLIRNGLSIGPLG